MYYTNRRSGGFDLGSEEGYARIRAAFNDHPEAREEGEYPPEGTPHVSIAWACLQRHRDTLNPWERQFLASIMYFRSLSPKQSAALARIRAKVDTSPARPEPKRPGPGRRAALWS
jgi:hypothetical protein